MYWHEQPQNLTGTARKPYVEQWEFNYELKTAPTSDPITLAEAKHFARIDDSGDSVYDALDDALITQLIKAATSVFEGQTGRSLITQTWVAWLDSTPASNVLRIGKGNIISVSSIKGYADDGTTSTLDSGSYVVDAQNSRIGLIGGDSWPTSSRNFNGFAVEYVAGYGAASAVPDGIKIALGQMVSHWYEHRETATDLSFNNLPMATQLLVNTFKIARV